MPTPIHLSPATPPVPVPQDVLSYPGSATSPVPTFPEITPTVAETGLPVAAGPGGPGPASGSLHDIKRASNFSGPRTSGFPATQPQSQPETYGQAPSNGPAYPSAEEEKRRLAASYSQQAPPPAAATPSPATQPPHETAEEEMKRLEREERERVLHGGSGPNVPPKDNKEDDLPPYQEPGL